MAKLISIKDAQRELGGIGRTTLYQLVKQGHLSQASIGRRAFITGESIDAYIESICCEE